IRSNGSADISITGDWFPFTISGNYNVKEGLLTKNFDQEVASNEKSTNHVYLPKILRQNSFDPLLLDIKVIMPRNFIIKNANADGNIFGTLQIKGAPDKPRLLGIITAEKNTKLLFRDRVFNIINGTVEFKDTEDLNPEVFLNAQSRIDEYDVTLSVQGPVKSLQMQMTSSPPLPENEIITLLAFGVTTSKLDQNIASQAQTEKLGYEIGQYIYRSNPLLRKKIKDTFGVDVDIITDFDSTTNTNVNKVTGSKKLTDKISVRASRTLGGPSTTYEAEATYRINSNLSTLGKWKSQEATETQNIQGNSTATTDLFGIDLEFKREFK
ncbi:MAG TPA: translocation/assembly module TamB domain-containing protein, partial [Pseudobdellovibrionaceae bacterium]|nr:translocation/assembly module TamB domain-containing protein [Pseudobdellovibrionaceae bacterium]